MEDIFLSDGVVFLVLRAEGRAPQGVQAVDQDEGPCQVSPALGDGVLHLVQAQVQLLQDVPVAVPDLSRPRHQEVVRRLPHGLKREREHPIRGEDIRRFHTGVLFPVLFPFSSDSAWNFAFTPKRELSSENFYPLC